MADNFGLKIGVEGEREFKKASLQHSFIPHLYDWKHILFRFMSFIPLMFVLRIIYYIEPPHVEPRERWRERMGHNTPSYLI